MRSPLGTRLCSPWHIQLTSGVIVRAASTLDSVTKAFPRPPSEGQVLGKGRSHKSQICLFALESKGQNWPCPLEPPQGSRQELTLSPCSPPAPSPRSLLGQVSSQPGTACQRASSWVHVRKEPAGSELCQGSRAGKPCARVCSKGHSHTALLHSAHSSPQGPGDVSIHKGLYLLLAPTVHSKGGQQPPRHLMDRL